MFKSIRLSGVVGEVLVTALVKGRAFVGQWCRRGSFGELFCREVVPNDGASGKNQFNMARNFTVSPLFH